MSVLMAVLGQATADAEYALPIAFGVAAGAGILIGFIYRVGAAVIVCLAIIVAIFMISVKQDWSILRSVAIAFGLITVVQVGYLIGLFLIYSSERTGIGSPRPWRRGDALDEAARGSTVVKPPER